jgi:hypothetical protein
VTFRSFIRWTLAALLAAALIVPVAHAARGNGAKTLMVRGRVTDSSGWPRAGAIVSVVERPQIAAVADDYGRYTLSIPVGSLVDLAREPMLLRIVVGDHGWHFTTPGGSPALAIDLRVTNDPVTTNDQVTRFEVRSNEPLVAASIANGLVLDGDATALVDLNFVGREGAAPTPLPAIALKAREQVALTGINIPRSKAPADSDAPATAARASRDAGDSKARGTRDATTRTRHGAKASPSVEAPKPAPPPDRDGADKLWGARVAARNGAAIDASTSGAGACSCRIHGTVAIRSGKRVSEPLRVAISVRDAPDLREVVSLEPGQEQSFDLTVPCGTHQLEIQTFSRIRFWVTSKEAREPVECEPGGSRTLDIALEPR